MDDDRDDDLFGDEPADLFDAGLAQDGPDLFGTEPDELILPPEPVPTPDPDMDLPEDEMDEIPVDPDESDESDEDVPDAVAPRPQLAPPPSRPRPAAPARRDAPLALYRRYRPDTFAEVIGQEHVTEPLQRALVNNRVNHAYLFSGPRGCGKTTSARILARCLNCEEGPTDTPCGVCRSCEDLARGGPGSIDVIEMDAATHGLVDDARALRERAFFSPVHSRYKIYIIDEAHMVTPQGFNALLKVVEEPPPHVKFIFATTEPEKVLGTIRSRTHHYPFRLVPPKTLTAYLARLCAEEGVRVEAAVLPLVVRAGAGSVRDSLSVLDQLLGGAGPDGVGYAQAAGLLGYTPDTLLDEIMDAFAAGDAQGVFACVDKVIEVGQDPRRFAEDLLRRLRDLIIVAAVPEALDTGLVDVAADQGERLITQARGLGAGELTRAAEVIANGLTEMRGTTAPRLHLELMCARVLLPGADVDGRGVHARLDRLERRLQMASPEGQAASAGQAPPGGASPRQATPDMVHESRQQAPAPEARPQASGPQGSGPQDRGGATASGPPVQQAPEPRPAPTAPEGAAPRQATPTGASPAPGRAPTSAPVAASTGGGHDPARLGTADLRQVWPQVLDAVKVRRRVTWIALQQNTQVHALADGVLILAVNNPGALETLQRGGSDDIIREAVLEVVGVAPKVRVVAAEGSAGPPPAAQPPRVAPAASGPVAPRRDPGDSPGSPGSAGSPASPASPGPATQARRNIRTTQVGPADESEAEPDRDDDNLEDVAGSADELLTQVLGAELIGEEDPRA